MTPGSSFSLSLSLSIVQLLLPLFLDDLLEMDTLCMHEEEGGDGESTGTQQFLEKMQNSFLLNLLSYFMW